MKNKRFLKNTVMIALLLALICSTFCTYRFIGNSTGGFRPQPPTMTDGNGPPGMNGSSDSSSDKNFGAPPDMKGGSDSNKGQNGQPPWADDNSSDNSFPDNSNNNQQQTPPQMPDNNSSDGNGNNHQPPQMGGQNNQNGFRSDKFSEESNDVLKYSLFAVESLLISMLIIYLIMSKLNKKSFRETLHSMNIIIIYILVTLILATVLTGAQIAATKLISFDAQSSHSQHMPDFNPNSKGNKPGSDNIGADVEASGATTVENEQTLTKTYSSKSSDESAILVQNGGNATVNGATIEKSGDSTNTENSEFYGVNAAVLVKENSTATIKDATINTSAKGANAVFSTGENSKIYISDSTITSRGESSARGLDATYGGYIEADNVKITTQGNSCAALATDRGEGTVKVKNSDLTTNGAGSPVIYSTGDISATNSKGTANGAQIAVIEGKNSATITSSEMTCSATGNRGDVDRAGVMIYQSMSGDASKGKGTFTAKDSTLSINKNSDCYKSAPMFFVTNTDAEINLENTKLSFGSGVLLDIEGTSEWGSNGSNGGNVTLNAKNQTLTGDIKTDKISTLEMNLTKSDYKGAINGGNTAQSVKLTLDKNSKITLTGDSYVTEFNNADNTNSNIDFNGYKLYVNGKAVN
ncbi:MAG: hypothetical protein K6F88_09460 [Ruminococcus sp.]|nr:hypothetical protein [Ruminococcus sp.]